MTFRTIACGVALCAAVCAVPLLAQDANPANQPDAPAQAPKANQADVPVKVVVLYSSGVGYFEHHGKVQGNATTEISFKSAQVNDLLKSLVLQDLDKGQVNAITYPSVDPIEKLLKSFQVDVSDNLSRADLLKQLRGAKVRCELSDGKTISGTIIGVEIEEVPTGEKGEIQKIPVLNLLHESGVTTIRLPSVRFVAFEDKRLQEELTKALAALAQSRDQDKKAVVIRFSGDGERRVKFGYVIEAPIWKTSYRLILDDRNKDTKPYIQGWAIIENQTDTDWNDVQLSLVSGRPISFVQDLYQPLYIPRPVVQPELYASIKPKEYDEGMNRQAAFAGREEQAEKGAMAKAPGTPPAPAAQMGRQLRRGGDMLQADAAMRHSVQAAGGAWAAEALDAVGVASAASASNLGELFQYTVSMPVTLTRQKSAMLPIIADDIDARRVSIYNASTLAKFPLNGAILINTTGKHLLNGPITVLDNGAYGGDARISDLPPGQQRLISYGIDLKVAMDSSSSKQEDTIQTAKIVKGTLQIAKKRVFSQEYKAQNKGTADKTLVIEHPRHANWTLVKPEKAMETTDTLYRFEMPAPAGKPASLSVQEEIVQWEGMAILPFDINTFNVYLRTSQIPQPVRDALQKAAGLRQSVFDSQRQLDQTRARLQVARQAQADTRENVKAIGNQAAAGDYYANQIKRLAGYDAEVDKLQAEIDSLQQQVNERQKALEDYLNNLNVG